MVKMDLVSSDDQASSMNMVSANRIAGYQSALTALESFSNASELTGAAYDSAKHYGARVLTPLIQGAILLSEGVSQGTTALPNKYRAEVGEESLDSDVLESQIQAYESSLSSLRGIYRYLERDCSTKPSTLRSMSSRMASLSNQKTEAMEKLRKLNAFAMSSPRVFSNLPEVSAAMDVGIGQVQTAFANFNGSFQVPSADQLGWAKTIGVEWKKKEELDRAYQRVLDKLKKGEKLTEKDIKAIEAYRKRYPNVKLDETTKVALDDYKESQKLLTKAEEAHKKGEIDDKTYQSIKSGIINFGASYVKELINAKITDKAVEIFTKSAVEWITHNINATQIGRSAALVGGGTVTIASDFNPVWAQFARGAVKYGVKYGIPVVGALVDFGMQKASGENTGDALIKTGAHVGIGVKAAAIGTAIGGPLGTAVGFGIGVLGSMAFDAVYDNKDKIADGIVNTTKKAIKAVEDVADKVGDAVSGLSKTLGSVFG